MKFLRNKVIKFPLNEHRNWCYKTTREGDEEVTEKDQKIAEKLSQEAHENFENARASLGNEVNNKMFSQYQNIIKKVFDKHSNYKLFKKNGAITLGRYHIEKISGEKKDFFITKNGTKLRVSLHHNPFTSSSRNLKQITNIDGTAIWTDKKKKGFTIKGDKGYEGTAKISKEGLKDFEITEISQASRNELAQLNSEMGRIGTVEIETLTANSAENYKLTAEKYNVKIAKVVFGTKAKVDNVVSQKKSVNTTVSQDSVPKENSSSASDQTSSAETQPSPAPKETKFSSEEGKVFYKGLYEAWRKGNVNIITNDLKTDDAKKLIEEIFVAWDKENISREQLATLIDQAYLLDTKAPESFTSPSKEQIEIKLEQYKKEYDLVTTRFTDTEINQVTQSIADKTREIKNDPKKAYDIINPREFLATSVQETFVADRGNPDTKEKQIFGIIKSNSSDYPIIKKATDKFIETQKRIKSKLVLDQPPQSDPLYAEMKHPETYQLFVKFIEDGESSLRIGTAKDYIYMDTVYNKGKLQDYLDYELTIKTTAEQSKARADLDLLAQIFARLENKELTTKDKSSAAVMKLILIQEKVNDHNLKITASSAAESGIEKYPEYLTLAQKKYLHLSLNQIEEKVDQNPFAPHSFEEEMGTLKASFAEEFKDNDNKEKGLKANFKKFQDNKNIGKSRLITKKETLRVKMSAEQIEIKKESPMHTDVINILARKKQELAQKSDSEKDKLTWEQQKTSLIQDIKIKANEKLHFSEQEIKDKKIDKKIRQVIEGNGKNPEIERKVKEIRQSLEIREKISHDQISYIENIATNPQQELVQEIVQISDKIDNGEIQSSEITLNKIESKIVDKIDRLDLPSKDRQILKDIINRNGDTYNKITAQSLIAKEMIPLREKTLLIEQEHILFKPHHEKIVNILKEEISQSEYSSEETLSSRLKTIGLNKNQLSAFDKKYSFLTNEQQIITPLEKQIYTFQETQDLTIETYDNLSLDLQQTFADAIATEINKLDHPERNNYKSLEITKDQAQKNVLQNIKDENQKEILAEIFSSDNIKNKEYSLLARETNRLETKAQQTTIEREIFGGFANYKKAYRVSLAIEKNPEKFEEDIKTTLNAAQSGTILLREDAIAIILEKEGLTQEVNNQTTAKIFAEKFLSVTNKEANLGPIEAKMYDAKIKTDFLQIKAIDKEITLGEYEKTLEIVNSTLDKYINVIEHPEIIKALQGKTEQNYENVIISAIAQGTGLDKEQVKYIIDIDKTPTHEIAYKNATIIAKKANYLDILAKTIVVTSSAIKTPAEYQTLMKLIADSGKQDLEPSQIIQLVTKSSLFSEPSKKYIIQGIKRQGTNFSQAISISNDYENQISPSTEFTIDNTNTSSTTPPVIDGPTTGVETLRPRHSYIVRKGDTMTELCRNNEIIKALEVKELTLSADFPVIYKKGNGIQTPENMDKWNTDLRRSAKYDDRFDMDRNILGQRIKLKDAHYIEIGQYIWYDETEKALIIGSKEQFEAMNKNRTATSTAPQKVEENETSASQKFKENIANFLKSTGKGINSAWKKIINVPRKLWKKLTPEEISKIEKKVGEGNITADVGDYIKNAEDNETFAQYQARLSDQNKHKIPNYTDGAKWIEWVNTNAVGPARELDRMNYNFNGTNWNDKLGFGPDENDESEAYLLAKAFEKAGENNVSFESLKDEPNFFANFVGGDFATKGNRIYFGADSNSQTNSAVLLQIDAGMKRFKKHLEQQKNSENQTDYTKMLSSIKDPAMLVRLPGDTNKDKVENLQKHKKLWNKGKLSPAFRCFMNSPHMKKHWGDYEIQEPGDLQNFNKSLASWFNMALPGKVIDNQSNAFKPSGKKFQVDGSGFFKDKRFATVREFFAWLSVVHGTSTKEKMTPYDNGRKPQQASGQGQ